MKLIWQVNIAHSLLHVMSKLFHIIILSLSVPARVVRNPLLKLEEQLFLSFTVIVN